MAMEKILFIEQNVSEDSGHLAQVIEIARAKRAELSALFVVPVSLETADWIETQERQIRNAEEKAGKLGEKIEQECNEKGLLFNWKVVQSAPTAFLEAIQSFTPVDVIIAGNVNLEPLAEKGIKHLEDISAIFSCPVLPVVSLLPDDGQSKAKAKTFTRLLAFGALSAVSYFLFFPLLDKLNHSIFMKGTVLGALAVMTTIPVHAYVYGSFTECFSKLLGLEKSAGSHH